MRELTIKETQMIDGGGKKLGLAAWGTSLAIGGATWGSSLGSIGVVAAFGAAPIAAAAMVGLALYGGYQLVSK